MEWCGLKRVYALALLSVALLLVTSLLIFLTGLRSIEQLAQIVRDACFTVGVAGTALQHPGLQVRFLQGSEGVEWLVTYDGNGR